MDQPNEARPVALREMDQLREVDQQLWQAVGAGQFDMDAFRAAMDGGANFNAIWLENGVTPLMLACIFGHQEAVDALLDAGADAFAACEAGFSVLRYALVSSRQQIAESLLARYSNHPMCTEIINRADDKGETCLMVACTLDLDGIVEKLVLAGADVRATSEIGMSVLHYSIATGQERNLEVLLRSENIEDTIDLADREGVTPLALACHADSAVMFQMLLDAGADVRATGARDGHVLHRAAAVDRRQIIKVFSRIEGIRDMVDLAGFDGVTPLMLACVMDNDVAAEMLLAAGSDPEKVDKKGLTALHLAVEEGSKRAVRTLAENAKIILDRATSEGSTPLDFACSMDRGEILQTLLDAGAAMDPLRALAIALSKGSLRVLQILVDHGVNLCTTIPNPFNYATEKRQVETAEFILESYVNQAVAQNGPMALHSILGEATYSYTRNDFLPPHGQLNQVHLPVGAILADHFSRHMTRLPLVSGLDDDGNTPLHTACALRAPFKILEMLVRRYPAALKIANNLGELPLHVLAASKPAVRTVQFFMDAYPTAIHMSTDKGQLPYHVALDQNNKASKEVIFELTTRAAPPPHRWLVR